MARDTLDRQLTARRAPQADFALATAADDAAIRRLLRENPTRGQISLSFEREPNYFHFPNFDGYDSQTVLGFLNEKLIGVGRCSFRPAYVNGEIRRVGYLSELRLDASVQGRFDILRRGYRFFHALHRAQPADFYFTSIAADNERSLRFLERRLPGMPVYQFAADFTTLLIPVPRHARSEPMDDALATHGLKCVVGNRSHATQLVASLNTHAKSDQLALFWTEADLLALESFGLALSDFRIVLDDQQTIVACAALWDQRRFKQTVVRGYASNISALRPLANLFSKLIGTVPLPPVGCTLAFGLVSPLAVPPADGKMLVGLIRALLPLAAERKLDFLTLGLAAADERWSAVRSQFRGREYRTRLYQVIWNRSEETVLDGRPLFPEIAFL